MNNAPKRCVAAARTLLWNFGQGIWSPHFVFMDCCKLVGCKPELQSIPDMQPIEIPISFFGKGMRTTFYTPNLIHLYNPAEEFRFLKQPSAVKLNWLRNFTYMQELLFNFSAHEHFIISNILKTWKRPDYDYQSIPFGVARNRVNGDRTERVVG